MPRFLLTACLLSAAALTQAQEHVFPANETGYPASAYVVTETAHTPATVTLSIPRFAQRSAPESRWMMCVYTNLAMLYGHPYWTAVYPPGGSDGDTVLIGFPATGRADGLAALGPAFQGPGALKTIMPVAAMKIFCDKLGYQYKFVPAD